LGLGNQDSCPWRECQTNKTMEFWRLFPMNWEAPSVLRRGSSHSYPLTKKYCGIHEKIEYKENIKNLFVYLSD
jgi:hypothetical protein